MRENFLLNIVIGSIVSIIEIFLNLISSIATFMNEGEELVIYRFSYITGSNSSTGESESTSFISEIFHFECMLNSV